MMHSLFIATFSSVLLLVISKVVSEVGSTCKINVALATNGATCSASSEYSNAYSCEKALDGGFLPAENEWATSGEGTGSWLQVTFDQTYMIQTGRLMQRVGSTECSKEVDIVYDTGSMQMILQPCTGTTASDVAGWIWNDMRLSPPAYTKGVRVTVLSVYSTVNNGIIEVEFHASPVSYIRQALSDTASMFLLMLDCYFDGYLYTTYPSVIWEDCATACHGQASCIGITFGPTKDLCQLIQE